MLEQKDFELLKQMIGEVIEEKLETKLENKLEPVRKDSQEIKENIQELKEMDKSVLDEVVRVHESTQKQIDEVKRNIEELKQYNRITKLESDNTTLLLKLIEGLTKRLEEVENRIA